jgi:hypothetical protein
MLWEFVVGIKNQAQKAKKIGKIIIHMNKLIS